MLLLPHGKKPPVKARFSPRTEFDIDTLLSDIYDMKDKPVAISTVDEYIKRFPKDIQALLREIRALIKETAPEATEKLSYGMPAYSLNGPLVYFAAFKKHIGIYPTPGGISAFAKELAPYASGKGSAKFPIDKPIPMDLIRKIVRYRAKEAQAKK